MLFYGTTDQEYNQHLQEHQSGNTNLDRRHFCRHCYPVLSIPTYRIPNGFTTFWIWIFNNYTARNYSSYTIAAFINLEERLNRGEAVTCIQLLRSIEFEEIIVPIEELSYYIVRLFGETNQFQHLPVSSQTEEARRIYHNQQRPLQMNNQQQN